jgi:hypothetical protein
MPQSLQRKISTLEHHWFPEVGDLSKFATLKQRLEHGNMTLRIEDSQLICSTQVINGQGAKRVRKKWIGSIDLVACNIWLRPQIISGLLDGGRFGKMKGGGGSLRGRARSGWNDSARSAASRLSASLLDSRASLRRPDFERQCERLVRERARSGRNTSGQFTASRR